jgi:hypothetical protein
MRAAPRLPVAWRDVRDSFLGGCCEVGWDADCGLRIADCREEGVGERSAYPGDCDVLDCHGENLQRIVSKVELQGKRSRVGVLET